MKRDLQGFENLEGLYLKNFILFPNLDI